VQDIERIDFRDIGPTDSPSQAMTADLFEQALPLPLAKLLGITNASDRVARVENDRSGDHVSGQRAPPGLVDTGDQVTGPRQQFVPIRH
jgi:hypothetical protein